MLSPIIRLKSFSDTGGLLSSLRLIVALTPSYVTVATFSETVIEQSFLSILAFVLSLYVAVTPVMLSFTKATISSCLSYGTVISLGVTSIDVIVLAASSITVMDGAFTSNESATSSKFSSICAAILSPSSPISFKSYLPAFALVAV